MESDPRTRFDLRVTVPVDSRFAEMIRDLVVHGALRAGCAAGDALAFGRAVEDAERDMLVAGSGPSLSIVVRRVEGQMEVVLSGDCGAQTLSLDI